MKANMQRRDISRVRMPWTIARMRRLIETWEKLEWMDKDFILRRIRDKEPQRFWLVANEGKGEPR